MMHASHWSGRVHGRSILRSLSLFFELGRGMSPIDPSSRRLLNQSTQQSVSNSTCSTLRQDPVLPITSVLYSPMVVSASALSYDSPTLPTEGSTPAASNRSVYLIDKCCRPRLLLWSPCALSCVERLLQCIQGQIAPYGVLLIHVLDPLLQESVTVNMLSPASRDQALAICARGRWTRRWALPYTATAPRILWADERDQGFGWLVEVRLGERSWRFCAGSR